MVNEMLVEISIIIFYLIINVTTISYQNFVDKFIENSCLYFEENKKQVQFGIKIYEMSKENKNNTHLSFLKKSLEEYKKAIDPKQLIPQLLNYNKLTYFGVFLLIFIILFTIYCFWFLGFEKTILLIIFYFILSYIFEIIFIHQNKKHSYKINKINFNILIKVFKYRFRDNSEFVHLEKIFFKVFEKYY